MRSRCLEIVLLGGALVTSVGVGGCRVVRPNPAHCFHALGDQTCAELDPTKPYCAGTGCSDDVDGCIAEIPADECYSPCGHDALLEDDASCIEVGDATETSSGTETETSSATETETGTDECTTHIDCPDEVPYCLLGTCASCDAAPNPVFACFELTEGQATICLDGACVSCTADEPETCIAAGLVCDLDTHACVPCTAHDQCAGGAGCDLVLGECLPPDAVWHVDGDGGRDFLTVGEALAALGNGSGTLIIHDIEVEGYAEGISFAGDRALAVFAAEGETPTLFMTPVSLEVLDGARVYARGLILRGQDAALVQSAHVEFDAVSLAPQLRHALRVEDATVRMRNSMLRTTLDPTYPALDMVGISDIDIRYATMVGLGDQAAVSCQGAALVPGSRIRNSMLVNLGEAAAVQCSSPSYEHNGLEDATGFVNNTTIGDATIDWFVNPLYGGLHLSIVAPISAATAARWSPGDPPVDFDGDPRPTIEGSADFVGADRVP
jgi:hypothetical protein